MKTKEIEAKLQEMREGFPRLPQQTQSERIHQLACRVIFESMLDYVDKTPMSDKQGLPKYFFNKSTILNDLASQTIPAASNGANDMAISALKNNPQQVKENIDKISYSHDIETIKVETYGKAEFR